MNKIKIGKNIKFFWTITYNGEYIDLNEHNVEVEITTPKRTKVIITPTIENGNKLVFSFKGKTVGAHYLSCYIDRFTDSETSCDYREPFYLVEKSWMEEDAKCCDLQTEFITLAGNIAGGVPGPRGPKGDKGDKGENATINGYNTLTITGGENVVLTQNEAMLEIGVNLSNYYDKATSDNKYAYIDNVYSKTESDNKYTTFTYIEGKTQFYDIQLGLKANKDDVYSKNDIYTKTEVDNKNATKQDTLISGTNIKTINGNDILGEGNIEIQGGGGGTTIWTGTVDEYNALTTIDPDTVYIVMKNI